MLRASPFEIFLKDKQTLTISREEWDSITNVNKIDIFLDYLKTSKLKKIILLNMPISEEDAIHIISILNFDSIKEFAISGEHLGDKFMDALPDCLLNSNNGININLYCSNLTDKGLQVLFNLLNRDDCPIKEFYIHAGKAKLNNACQFIYDLMKISNKKYGTLHAIGLEDLFIHKGFITIDHTQEQANEFLCDLSTYYLKLNNMGAGGIIIDGINQSTGIDRALNMISEIIDRIPIEEFRQIFGEDDKEKYKPTKLLASLQTLSIRYIVKNNNLFFNNNELLNLPKNLQTELEDEEKYINQYEC